MWNMALIESARPSNMSEQMPHKLGVGDWHGAYTTHTHALTLANRQTFCKNCLLLGLFHCFYPSILRVWLMFTHHLPSHCLSAFPRPLSGALGPDEVEQRKQEPTVD